MKDGKKKKFLREKIVRFWKIPLYHRYATKEGIFTKILGLTFRRKIIKADRIDRYILGIYVGTSEKAKVRKRAEPRPMQSKPRPQQTKPRLPRDAQHYHDIPIQSNKIVFRSATSGYSCNPRAIAEEILRRELPYDLVWVVDRYVLKYIDAFPPNLRLVMDENEEALREFATARIWVTSGWLRNYLRLGLFKRPEQVYIQTWHGSLGFKRLDWKAAHPSEVALLAIDMSQFDYLFTNSEWEDGIFRKAFRTPAQMLRIGHARNDIFFRADASTHRSDVRRKIGVAEDKKLLLHMPTWREDTRMTNFDLPEGGYAVLMNALHERFGGEWLIAARWHPSHAVRMRTRFLPAGSEVINVSDYPDAQELLLAADCVLTDYSSCILDFLFTGRPGFIYAPDCAQYEKMRGLYYPLEQAPFPVARDWTALLNNIENFDEQIFRERTSDFLRKMGCMEDGHAAARAVDLIEQIISAPVLEALSPAASSEQESYHP